MRDILSRGGRAALARFAADGTVAVVFDFDGTLAPIVRDPVSARMRASTRRLLRAVAGRYPCAVLSGRARADVVRRLGVRLPHVVGNHGIEWAEATGSARGRRGQVRRWQTIVESILDHRLPDQSGVVIENKRHSLAIHYRRAPSKRRATKAIAEAVDALGRVRRMGGKDVINVLPLGGKHKGTAVKRLRRLLGCDRVIYIGDDVTDEDVFALRDPRLLGVRVEPSRTSRARYYVAAQRDVDDFLRTLARLRAR